MQKFTILGIWENLFEFLKEKGKESSYKGVNDSNLQL